MNRPTCESCPYFVEMSTPYPGECRIRSTQSVFTPDTMIEHKWPQRMPMMWCGEHPKFPEFLASRRWEEGDLNPREADLAENGLCPATQIQGTAAVPCRLPWSHLEIHDFGPEPAFSTAGFHLCTHSDVKGNPCIKLWAHGLDHETESGEQWITEPGKSA